jgi:intein/homing endonuclease
LALGHKPFDGEKAYEVTAFYNQPIKVTEDHPFWAKHDFNDEADFIKVQELKKGDWIFVPVDREVKDVNNINLLDHLNQNDWVIEDGYITYKKNGEHYNRRSLGNQVPVEFEVSDEFLWLLGLYMAEGSSNDKRIDWYISNQEFYLRDRIIDSCKQVFGLDARYSENQDNNTFAVCLTAQPLATVIHKWCGKNAHDKHLPEWVMNLPKEKQLKVLEGILDGDGCYQDDKIYFLSVSPQFTEQVRVMMLRCGYFPSISHRSKKDFKTQANIEGTNIALILLGNDQYQFLNDINSIANNGYVYDKKLTGSYKPINRKQRFAAYHEDDGVWVQIRKINGFDYHGEMYYFTVAEDHSFVIGNYAVRNTWFFNMEDPDEQTRKIRDWCRLIYTTHYLVPSMIDIYSRFPLLGMEFAHPDKRVNEFFSELFWDGLQYQDFLYSLSREHWLIGDVFALGSWNDGIGAWEADELINPNDVVVAKNRALRTYQYHIKVPEEVKKLVETRQPEKEYAMLMARYPDVVEYANCMEIRP